MPAAARLANPILDRTVIVGVGLMGGSLGLALIENNVSCHVTGVDAQEVLDAAVLLGAVHSGSTDLDSAAAGANLIVIATPVHTVTSILKLIAPTASPDAVVTDVASVKSQISAAGAALLGPSFVGGHPMAGSEQTGIGSARSSLYHGAAWALTPGSGSTDSKPVTLLSNIVRAIGAAPVIMDAAAHDRAAALVSHLPHVICYAYNRAVNTSSDAVLALSLAAGSYRDLTRVAASDPILWRDVFMENREAVLAALGSFRESLAELEVAVRSGDAERIERSIRECGRL